MSFRVEALAAEADLGVDTIRYYQGLGLIEPPEREGRTAVYTTRHLDQLRSIRQLSDAGFTLAQIQRLVADDAGPLLAALANEAVGPQRLSIDELAQAAGVDNAVIDLAVAAGLLEPVGGQFSEDAVPMLRAARAILEAGVPLEQLTALAVDHARNVEAIAERAIDLVLDEVPHHDADELARLFPGLIDNAGQLVAQHFRRTLLTKSLDRLRRSGDRELADALAEACTWP